MARDCLVRVASGVALGGAVGGAVGTVCKRLNQLIALIVYCFRVSFI